MREIRDGKAVAFPSPALRWRTSYVLFRARIDAGPVPLR
ncbi:protein of unknown function [Blastococcus saxobsidens DD2]|uniref:Uncharacterized protein n=1 Tax=Blastococcus saxobsidens (strain DD2) TaxID=1146883 RepID=H6RLN9_BLASD|nr:protein of unknown function [Blastococcus saxobsidens DD2]